MASILRNSPPLPLFSIRKTSPETLMGLPSLPTRQSARLRAFRVKPSTYRAKALRFYSFIPSAASGEAAKLQEIKEIEAQESEEELTDDGPSDGSIPVAEEAPGSALMSSLEAYKEALTNHDESKLAEIETFLQSLEDEKKSLEEKVADLSEEFLLEKDRILRVSADFDNFRKRTERERSSLMENVRGEVVESLLPVLDNFERAKAQIKVETEEEDKINNSYQSINKQFVEILTSLGVAAVETVGSAFDPMLHDAILREDSVEFEEGIVIGEFRKGFKLGERLLRPAMVKVSAGPGPVKAEELADAGEDEGDEELGRVGSKGGEDFI